MRVNKFRRLFSALLAVVMVSSMVPVQAASIDDGNFAFTEDNNMVIDDVVIEEVGSADSSGIEIQPATEGVIEVAAKHKLSVDIGSVNGSVKLVYGGETYVARVEDKTDGTRVATVSRGNEVVRQAAIPADSLYAFEADFDEGTVVHVEAVADEGYNVAVYSVDIDAGGLRSVDTGFNKDQKVYTVFSNDVTIGGNDVVARVDFVKAEDAIIVEDAVGASNLESASTDDIVVDQPVDDIVVEGNTEPAVDGGTVEGGTVEEGTVEGAIEGTVEEGSAEGTNEGAVEGVEEGAMVEDIPVDSAETSEGVSDEGTADVSVDTSVEVEDGTSEQADVTPSVEDTTEVGSEDETPAVEGEGTSEENPDAVSEEQPSEPSEDASAEGDAAEGETTEEGTKEDTDAVENPDAEGTDADADTESNIEFATDEPTDAQTAEDEQTAESETPSVDDGSLNQVADEETTEHFVDSNAYDTSDLDPAMFTSMRLVMIVSDASVIVDPENVIGEYDGSLYMLAYRSVEQTMNAYAYYRNVADAVEPDTVVTASGDTADDGFVILGDEGASDEAPAADDPGFEIMPADDGSSQSYEANTEPVGDGIEVEGSIEFNGEDANVDDSGISIEGSSLEAAPVEGGSDEGLFDEPVVSQITDDYGDSVEDNPVSVAAATDVEPASPFVNLIALIDTDTSNHPNVVDHISVLTSQSSVSHGDKMVSAIVSQNPDARILSITAMDENGYGTVGSVVAAIELAIDSGAQIINLSLCARATLSTSVVANEIKKAQDNGIIVVASAGNNGDNTAGYVPANIDSIYVIGAATVNGNRQLFSNYGATVDYNVVAESTSEAAALFTGFVSHLGIEAVESVIGGGLIYQADHTGDDTGVAFEFEDGDALFGATQSNVRLDLFQKGGFQYSSVGMGESGKWTSWYNHKIYGYTADPSIQDAVNDQYLRGTCLQPTKGTPRLGTNIKKSVAAKLCTTPRNPISGAIDLSSDANKELFAYNWMGKIMYLAGVNYKCSVNPNDPDEGSYWGDSSLSKNKRFLLVHLACSGVFERIHSNRLANDPNDWSNSGDWCDGAKSTARDQARALARAALNHLDVDGLVFHVIFDSGDQNVGGYMRKGNPPTEEPDPYYYRIHKDPAARNDVEQAVLNLGGTAAGQPYNQAGATFHVVTANRADGNVDLGNVTTDADGNTGRIEIPANIFGFQEDPAPAITITEVGTPYGSQWSVEPTKDAVVADSSPESPVVVTFSDPPRYNQHDFQLVKTLAGSGTDVAQGSINYDQVRFTLYYSNNPNCPDLAYARTIESSRTAAWEWRLHVKTIDGKNKAILRFDGEYLMRNITGQGFIWANGRTQPVFPIGTYYLKETTAPAYHNLGNVEMAWTVTSNDNSPNGAVMTILGSSSNVIPSDNGGTITGTIYEDTPRYGLKIQKRDYDTKETVPQGDASLAGITFQVINRSTYDVEYPVGSGVTYAPGADITGLQLVTDENGFASTASQILPVGRYGVREVATNVSYLLTETTEFVYDVHLHSVAEATTGFVFWPDLPADHKQADDKVVRGGIHIQKFDDDLNEGNPQGNASLNRTEFKVWNASLHDIVMLDENGEWDPETDRYRPFVTNSEDTEMRSKYLSRPACLTLYCDGYGVAESGSTVLPYGTYVVMETKASPSGTYKLNTDWAVIFQIREQGQIVSVNEPFNANIDPSHENQDPPYTAGVYFQKIDVDYDRPEPEGDGTLAGAIIAIYNDSQNEIYYAPHGRRYAPGEEIFRLYSDEHGHFETDTAAELPDGDYYAIEVAAPRGYKINRAWKVRFQVNTTNYGTRIDACHIGGENPADYPNWTADNMILKDNPIRGGVNLGKIDTETGLFEPQGDATLAGATIRIWNKSAHPIVMRGGTIVQPGDPVADLMIDENGRREIKRVDKNGERTDEDLDNDFLVYGTYMAREIKAPYGYKLNTEWEEYFTIRGREDVDDNPLAYLDIADLVGEAVDNEIYRMDVPVVKIDNDDQTNTPQGDGTLAGAKLDIYNLSMHQIWFSGAEGGPAEGFYSPSETHPFFTATTNANGVATFPDLPVGTYMVKERSASTGYEINQDWYIKFQVIMNENRTGLVYKELEPDPRETSPGVNNAAMTPLPEKIIRGGVTLHKIDGDSTKRSNNTETTPQGDASFEHAVFGVYNSSDHYVYVKVRADGKLPQVSNDEGNTGDEGEGEGGDQPQPQDEGTLKRFEVGALIGTLETDAAGNVSTANDLLPYGTYTVRELDHSYGYYTNTDWSVTFSVRELHKVYDLNNDHTNQRLPETVMRAGVELQKLDFNTTLNHPQGNALFQGAQVTIYNNSKNSVVVRGVEYPVGAACLVLTATNDGVFRSNVDDLPVGTYYAVETKAPLGYYLNTEWRCDFSITEADRETIVKPSTRNVIDKVKRAGVKFQKIDKMLQNSNPHGDTDLAGAVFTILNASTNPVTLPDSSVEIPSIKNSLGSTVTWQQLNTLATAGTGVVSTLTCTADGVLQSSVDLLSFGTYYIIETSPCRVGYHLNNFWVGRVDITEDNIETLITPVDYNNVYGGNNVGEVDNQIWRAGVDVVKFDLMRDDVRRHGDADLRNAEFVIVNASVSASMNKDGVVIPTSGLTDETATYDAVLAASSTCNMQTIKTNVNGYATTGLLDLPYGTYYIVEAKAPVGYFIDTGWVGKVVVREDNKIYHVSRVGSNAHDEYNHSYYESIGRNPVVTEGDDRAVRNQIFRGGIAIQKIDKEMGTNVVQGDDTTLAGAQFTIINSSAKSVRNRDRHDIATANLGNNPSYAQVRAFADAGNCVVEVIETDAEGFASTGTHDLPYGTYYVIETKAPEGYWLDDNFVGKVVIRSDGVIFNLTETDDAGSSFVNINDVESPVVKDQIRRSDLAMLKVNIDGDYKQYIPFLISAIEIDKNGNETVIEQHVIVCDEYGRILTSVRDPEHVNGMDQYLYGASITEEGEAHLQEAASWGVWFQGNATDYPKTAVNTTYGALYPGWYRVTELQCRDNADLEENLEESELIWVENTTGSLTDVMVDNANKVIYHPLVDTEIVLHSIATDVESGRKSLPARESIEFSDRVMYSHVTSDRLYRMETKLVDIDDNDKPVRLLATNDPDAHLSDDKIWIVKEFYPQQQSGVSNTWGDLYVSGVLDTTALKGHTLMAVDYLYQYIDISYKDTALGDWVLVARHPHKDADGRFEEDDDQKLYVPDLHTNATDILTGDRTGAKSVDDGVADVVTYKNLSGDEVYIIGETLRDPDTGDYMKKDDQGNPVWVYSPIFFRRGSVLINGTIKMPDIKFDSSAFKDGQSVVVTEAVFRADEDGHPMGLPIIEHDNLLDEDQTIRWHDITTTAVEPSTTDKVGSLANVTTINDHVHVSNVVFDDDDNNVPYRYKLVATLVYQSDFTDSDGVVHKAGDPVPTLSGTKSTVLVTSDAAGNGVLTYEGGGAAPGSVTVVRHGYNVASKVDPEHGSTTDYIEDPHTAICTIDTDIVFKVDSMKLQGATTVVLEKIYHDAAGSYGVLTSEHTDILDDEQSIHFVKMDTYAHDSKSKESSGTIGKGTVLVDTVILTNLVPGNEYTIRGYLMDQENGHEFKVNGWLLTDTAHIRVTEDGRIECVSGQEATVTSYDPDRHTVNGTVDMIFIFDSTVIEDRTMVAFEELFHNSVKIAEHTDLNDQDQSVHYPEVRTVAADGYTKDKVASVRTDGVIVDTVKFKNLVIDSTYTLNATLINKATGEPILGSDGNAITASRTFKAGEPGEGITFTDRDTYWHRVNGTIDVTFEFDSKIVEGVTAVVYEDLVCGGAVIARHADIHDTEQIVHFPKIRTSAIDATTGSNVGYVGETVINDNVQLWNLIPGERYEIRGVIVDKATGEPVVVNGEPVSSSVKVSINSDGTVDTRNNVPCTCTMPGGHCTCGNGALRVENYDPINNSVDAHVSVLFHFDSTTLAGKDVVVFEYLYHNGVVVAAHEDINDDSQTIHFLGLYTTAVDSETGDHAGTLSDQAIVYDSVKYSGLVVDQPYTLKGTLMNRDTGAPVMNENGRPVTSTVHFVATPAGGENNTVTAYHEDKHTVDGEYLIAFVLDSKSLEGISVVAFEDLYHDGKVVVSHSDLNDPEQSIHYPDMWTIAVDEDTGDHVGSIFGSLINGVRHLFGDTDTNGNGIADDREQVIVDTVGLVNLVPGYTYVVSGQLYDADASLAAGNPVPLKIEGQSFTNNTVITVSEDGKHVTATNGAKANIIGTDSDTGTVNCSVDLTYTLDSSKIQGSKVVVFERLYHDKTYTASVDPASVNDADLIARHEDIEDENQTVSEVRMTTVATDQATGDHIGAVPEDGDVAVIRDEVTMDGLVPGMEYRLEGFLVDLNNSDFENGVVKYLTANGTSVDDAAAAMRQTLVFTAERAHEVRSLNFGLVAVPEGHAVTVFENLYHNSVKITTHPANNARGMSYKDVENQTVRYLSIYTTAKDILTDDQAGKVGTSVTIVDAVIYEDLPIGKTFTLRGVLMNKATGESVKDAEGNPIVSEETFVTSKTGSMFNKVTSVNTKTNTVSGSYELVFELDSTLLAGKTAVPFEYLWYNGAIVAEHADLDDPAQSVYFPDIDTVAVDPRTGTHVSSVYGANQPAIDTIVLSNLVPGYTYVVSGKLYDYRQSVRYAMNVPYMVNGNEFKTAETITISADGTSISTRNGSDAEIIRTGDTVDAVVVVTFNIDSSELAGKRIVAFENLYHNDSYTPDTDPDTVSSDDIIRYHEDINDDDQSISYIDTVPTVTDPTTDDIVGKVPDCGPTDQTTIEDRIDMDGLLPGEEYTITAVLVDVYESLEAGKPIYIKGCGETTENVDEAVSQTVTFTAVADSEDRVLTFKMKCDKLLGKAVAVFEEIYHEDTKIVEHPVISPERVDTEAIYARTILYPASACDALDTETGAHVSFANGTRTIEDIVYFENLIVGREYTIKDKLVYQSDFTDANGNFHKAGSTVSGASKSMTFTVDSEIEGVDNVVVKTLTDNLKVASGYAKITFDVNTSALAGATLVAFDNIIYNGVKVFRHEDLDDLMQMIRIPKVTTAASVDGRDEVLIYDENGNPRNVKVTDRVTYENLWTEAELQQMSERAGKIKYCDDTLREQAQGSDIFTVDEVSSYVLKGVLVDKDTGEVLTNVSGDTYTVYSDVFTSGGHNGNRDMVFELTGSDFMTESGSILEGRTIVVYEDMYAVETVGDIDESNHIASHRDINDGEQDVRFPVIATHAQDGNVTVTVDEHDDETASSSHESVASKNMTITDTVSYENLHGSTVYTVVGALQVLTDNGYEAALDDSGDPITVTKELHTEGTYDDSVSGSMTQVFKFNGENLAGKTVVVFETLLRGDDVLADHADINDLAQMIYVPEVRTHAGEAMSGLDEVLANSSVVIVDRVTYENLEAGKTYRLVATMHKKSDGTEHEGSKVIGVFVAGAENQVIMPDGTAVMTAGELKDYVEAVAYSEVVPEVQYTDIGMIRSTVEADDRVDGEVNVVIPVNTDGLGGDTIVTFERLYSPKESTPDSGDDFITDEREWKIVGIHEDINDPAQSVKVPEINTEAKIEGGKEALAADSVKIVDTVTYTNLTPGVEYTMRGALMDKDSGEEIGVYGSSVFTPEEADGTVEVEFTFDASELDGHQLVTFERATRKAPDGSDYLVAAHEDIDDPAQTVYLPKVRTHAGEAMSGYDEVAADSDVVIVDRVTYENLALGQAYRLKATMHKKSDGTAVEGSEVIGVFIAGMENQVILPDGTRSMTAEELKGYVEDVLYSESADASSYPVISIDPAKKPDDVNERVDGEVNVVIPVDTSEMAGDVIVTFERLYAALDGNDNPDIENDDDWKTVGIHEDINDPAQSVRIPDINTEAEIDGGKEALAAESITMIDTVTYKGLTPGVEYTLHGTLVDKVSDEAIGVNGETTFTPDAATGTAEVKFIFDATELEGRQLVTFEVLTRVAPDGSDYLVAAHEEIDDLAQTVYLPKMRTHAGEALTEIDEVAADSKVVIVDRVTYENLENGRVYRLKGTMHRKSDGTELEDSEVVGVFIAGKDNQVIMSDGTRIMDANRLKDYVKQVFYNGSKIKVRTENIMIAGQYTELAGDRVNGEVNMVIPVDTTELAGDTIVTFEKLYALEPGVTGVVDVKEDDGWRVIGVHEDINDPAQSVRVPEINTDAEIEGGKEALASNELTLVDTVTYTNLTPGVEYTMHGTLMDKVSGEEVGIYGETVFTAETSDGFVEVKFTFDATELEGRQLVTFETLTRVAPDGSDYLVAAHEEISDPGQTVYLPKVRTHAGEAMSGLHEVPAGSKVVIVDRVTYENLENGKTYRLKATMHRKSNGEALAGSQVIGTFIAGGTDQVIMSDGTRIMTAEQLKAYVEAVAYSEDGIVLADSKIVASTDDVTNRVNGEVNVVIPVDTVELDGDTIVTFERLYAPGDTDGDIIDINDDDDWRIVGIHEDINDPAQTVYIPALATHAGEVMTELDEVLADSDVVIVDRVTYENLENGRVYRLRGTMHRKSDGGAIEESTVTGLFIAGVDNQVIMPDGTRIMTDADLKGYVKDMIYSASEPEVKTENIKISGGAELAGDRVNGEVNMVIPVSTMALGGDTIVTFEKLYAFDVTIPAGDISLMDDTEWIEIGAHEDINDPAQSVKVPEINTDAEIDGGKEALASDELRMIDTVTYTNLTPGVEYTMHGTLVDKDSGDEIGVYGETVFTPEEADGAIEVVFTFDASELEGRQLVTFETLTRVAPDGSDYLVAEHKDINDPAQTVYLPKVRTHAGEAMSGLHEVPAGSKVVIVDRVTYENLENGKTYRLKATMHKKSDGTVLEGSEVIGTFIAGKDNQVIMSDGTRIMTAEQLKDYVEIVAYTENGSTDIKVEDSTIIGESANIIDRVDGEVNVVIPVDTVTLDGDTIVTFERLYAPGKADTSDIDIKDDDDWRIVGIHEDITDPAQTVYIPSVATHAGEAMSGLNEVPVDSKVVIVDRVTYENLEDDKVYKLVATLHKKSDGTALDGSKVIGVFVAGRNNQVIMSDGTRIMTAEQLKDYVDKVAYAESGSTDIKVEDIKPDASVEAVGNRVDGEVNVVIPVNTLTLGDDIVVTFEQLFAVAKHEAGDTEVDIGSDDDWIKIGAHEEINDPAQSVHVLKIDTNAKIDGGKEALAAKKVTMTDTVSYKGLTVGVEYTMRGTLMDKVSGKSISITGETVFTPTEPDGKVEVKFIFDATLLEGRQLVTFERLTRKGPDGSDCVVAKHEDINDPAQTVYLPKLRTHAGEAMSGLNEVPVGSKVVIVDRVTYENLEAGKVYRLKATMHKKSDGTEHAGSEVIGVFIAGKDNQVIMSDGTRIMNAEQLKDYVEDVAYGKAGAKSDIAVEDIKITGSSDETKRVSGEVNVVIPVNTTTLGNDTIVTFERLYAPTATGEVDITKDDDWKVVGVHEDINDPAQSVHVLKIDTNAKIEGGKEALAAKKLTIIDTVTYKGLMVGVEYTMSGTLMDKASGKSIGVTGKTVFKPEKADGTVEVKFVFDGTKLGGRQLVTFERLTRKGPDGSDCVVARHEDINDAAQTVKINEPGKSPTPTPTAVSPTATPTPASPTATPAPASPTATPKPSGSNKKSSGVDTGDIGTMGLIGGGAAMLLLLAALFIIRRRRMNRG